MGVDDASPKAEAGYDAVRRTWARITQRAGVDSHAQVDRSGFVDALCSAHADGAIAQVFRPVIEAHVALVDTDGDGAVTLQEFIASQAAHGIPEDEAEEALHRLQGESLTGVDHSVASRCRIRGNRSPFTVVRDTRRGNRRAGGAWKRRHQPPATPRFWAKAMAARRHFPEQPWPTARRVSAGRAGAVAEPGRRVVPHASRACHTPL
ncbi:hypothetical protein [Streptomyces sp. NPDC050659]|uniref:EF-hand domain-containing protein n=1 Tax=Streptomyces sp. NPDC050659 TaxID=3157215 RepID=UPI003441FFBE